MRRKIKALVILPILSLSLLTMGTTNGQNQTAPIPPSNVPTRAIIVAIDCLDSETVRWGIDEGLLPNFSYLAENGAYFERCITVFPSISINNDFSIQTGAYPGKHEILAWGWYDYESDEFFNIVPSMFLVSLRAANILNLFRCNELMSDDVETMYEVMEKECDNALTLAGSIVGRGADLSLADLTLPSDLELREASSVVYRPGLCSSGSSAQEIDPVEDRTEELLPLALNTLFTDSASTLFALIGILLSTHYEKSLIHLWWMAQDSAAHLTGSRSENLLRSYQVADARLGLILHLCKLLGMEDETLFVIVGNHGHKTWDMDQLNKVGGREYAIIGAILSELGLEHVIRNGGVYIICPDRKEIQGEELDAFYREVELGADKILGVGNMRWVAHEKPKDGYATNVVIKSEWGTAELSVREWGEKISDTDYEYEILDGQDPLQNDIIPYNPFKGVRIEDLNHDGEAPIQYPNGAERILGLFQSGNHPDILYDMGLDHEGLGYEESCTPLIFSGPGVKRKRSDQAVSIVDVAPTTLRLMGLREPEDCDGKPLDIVDRGVGGRLPEGIDIILPIGFVSWRPALSFWIEFRLCTRGENEFDTSVSLKPIQIEEPIQIEIEEMPVGDDWRVMDPS